MQTCSLRRNCLANVSQGCLIRHFSYKKLSCGCVSGLSYDVLPFYLTKVGFNFKIIQSGTDLI